MKREDIVRISNESLATEFEIDVNDITPEASLVQTLDLDSLDMVDVIVLVEREFHFTPKASDFETIKTFNDFYDFVEQKLTQA